jgi:hypothetical protein
MGGGGIFISYRRQDAPGYAGRLYDVLAARFGDDHVFRDIGGIEPGTDFANRIGDAVGSCAVLLAVIGPQWTTVTDATGTRRLDDPDDFVGLEVGSALRRPDVIVIAVLVDSARMPPARELPAALAELARRQALELSDRNWRYDVDSLLATLERVLGRASSPERRTDVQQSTYLSSIAVATLAALWPAYRAYDAGLKLAHDSTALEIARLAAAWAGFWAVLSFALALAQAIVGPPPRPVIARGLAGLSVGLIAGALGGAVNGALRYQYDLNQRWGISASRSPAGSSASRGSSAARHAAGSSLAR